MQHLRRQSLKTICVCLLLLVFQSSLFVAPVQSQDLSQIDRGVIQDRVRSYIWFRDANAKNAMPGVSNYRSLTDFGLLNDLQLEGLREGIEADEWFRRSENQGNKDMKSLLQQLR